jgi:hypothetical protein
MLLVILMSQSAVLTLVFVFMTLQARAVHGFVPARDYVHYIDRAYPLSPAHEAAPVSALGA